MIIEEVINVIKMLIESLYNAKEMLQPILFDKDTIIIKGVILLFKLPVIGWVILLEAIVGFVKLAKKLFF